MKNATSRGLLNAPLGEMLHYQQATNARIVSQVRFAGESHETNDISTKNILTLCYS
ncbi:hypothetical protein Pan161_42220 [Gimesia algae]|uniref:Uncharacterized protein n=1 Tax=Gimesia algae TaxID=2527971 RepID=A0A517VHR4_9PLAN|nr:hypothetical protein Pan161_42220 [Gimesia algae]